mmetsp:Transcript_18549/g.21346  ORF Transcript_18549/g.21346 Transcript_18549/m.21346 type:complete len:410 (-) Transcript_18549:160-1389(-)|eukprot:CAMPEP_0194409110 /NCGR_PEP_ID=MMETSP0176-20130528/6921_1 /TAXON_ID=216777 /ORGANISM="Proboscia alata, Strain PI-D3" /LENGTH=409 /DNA_ID=CAMNT_0039209503 /DNA_START=20 /DNA_END=1249 /DNA_ORIENTATION=-
MKILKRNISAKDGSGSIVLRPDNTEDLWHAYNLFQTHDLVRCTTVRKVVKESSTGSTSSSKVRMSLTIEVQKIEFDPDSISVRISGPNREESNFVRMGAFHTLSVEIGRQFSLEKPCWDQIFLDRVDESCHPERDADIAAVVMAANGLAHVCLVTTHLTINKQRIDVTIPKKRSGSSAQSKSTTKFFEQVYQAILRHVDFSKIKCVLIGSPGFVKDDFYKFLQTEATRRSDRPFIENKNKFVLCKASSGHKHALEEVFADQNIMSRLTETKVAKEVGALHRFMRMMDTDPHQAQYGYLLVQKADEQMAIDTLLVTDELFRSTQVETRKKYVKLVESVREHGGAVYLLSTMHVSGVQLQQVSGVAAILRFPLPELADFDDEEEDTDDDSDSSEDPFVNSCEPAVDLNDEF